MREIQARGASETSLRRSFRCSSDLVAPQLPPSENQAKHQVQAPARRRKLRAAQRQSGDPVGGADCSRGTMTRDRQSSARHAQPMLALIGLIIILALTNQVGHCQARAITKQDLPVGNVIRASGAGASAPPLDDPYGYAPSGQPVLADMFVAAGAPATATNGGLGSNFGDAPWKRDLREALQQQTAAERSLDYAIQMGCQNLADNILSARALALQQRQFVDALSSQQQQTMLANLRDPKALEMIDLVADQQGGRTKKASPKHTPRFG